MAQLKFNIAKLSSFILTFSTIDTSQTIHSPTSSYVLQTVNPIVFLNSFSCLTDNVLTEIFNLLRPYV